MLAVAPADKPANAFDFWKNEAVTKSARRQAVNLKFKRQKGGKKEKSGKKGEESKEDEEEESEEGEPAEGSESDAASEWSFSDRTVYLLVAH